MTRVNDGVMGFFWGKQSFSPQVLIASNTALFTVFTFHLCTVLFHFCFHQLTHLHFLDYVSSSILNVPGESTLRRDFLRLQQENKERSEALKRQQAQLAAQRRDPEEHKRQLLHDRQKRIEEQKEQRRRLEEVHIHTHTFRQLNMISALIGNIEGRVPVVKGISINLHSK